jgi:Ca-activated chloride channel homolog
VAVLALALIGGGAAFAAMRWTGNDRGGDNRAGGACADETKLRLVIAPELEAVMKTAIEKTAPATGSCPVVAVSAQEPADTLAQKDKAGNYDGWVPSSTVWLRLGEADKLGFASTGPLLARSPIVVAMPKPYAERLGWPAKQPAWAEIVALTYSRQIPKFSMPDPLRDTTGLLSTLAVYGALARRTPDPGIAQLQALTLRSRLADPAADPKALLDRMAAQSDPAEAVKSVGLFPVSERALWAYARGTHETELVASYTPDALPEAEYPLALNQAASGDPTRKDLADKLAAWFASPEGVTALADNGLRGPAGRDSTAVVPAGPGFVAKYPQPVALPTDPAAVRVMTTQWAQYKRLTFQTLVLVDASGSMNEPVRDRAGNNTTKAELLRRAGVQAAQLFGEDTSVGMWMFGTPGPQSPPYVEVLPFGPLDEQLNGQTRRKRLGDAAAGYQAMPAAGTPLFETVLRANTEMQKRWKPDAVTLIVVLTDGHDRDTAYAMPKADFLKKLAAGRDPNKPVPIHSIAYGADADLPTLTEMSKATGGQVAQSNDPADLASAVAKIFLAARRATG